MQLLAQAERDLLKQRIELAKPRDNLDGVARGSEFLRDLVDDAAVEIEMERVELALQPHAEIDPARHDEGAARRDDAALPPAGQATRDLHRAAQMHDDQMVVDRL